MVKKLSRSFMRLLTLGTVILLPIVLMSSFKIQFRGTIYDVQVLNSFEYEMNSYMKGPEVLDTSQFVLSPMPGS